MNYSDMVSTLYAGKAIERLPVNGSEYMLEAIAKALGCSEDPDITDNIYNKLWTRGYRVSDYGPGRTFKFTYLQAVEVICLIAPALLDDDA